MRFVPAGDQPLQGGASIGQRRPHRLAMTERLVAGHPGLRGRSGRKSTGAGYLTRLTPWRRMAAAHPGAELLLLLGADALRALRAVAGAGADSGAGDDRRAACEAMTALADWPGDRVQVLQTRRVDISSTELRARVRDGRSIRGFVPDAVADYIAEHRLYR